MNRKGYYDGLKNVTEKDDWESWILYILDAVEHTASQTISKIDAVTSLMEKMITQLKASYPKIYSKGLVEVLFAKPYCRIAEVSSSLGIERKTASDYLKKIASLSLLNVKKTGTEMLYTNQKLLEILRK